MDLYKKIMVISLLLAFACWSVSAYIITLDAPTQVYRGSPLVVNGNVSFPVDSHFDVALFYSKNTAGEVDKQKIIVDDSQQFRIVFNTTDLSPGQYKIEVANIVANGETVVNNQLGSASKTTVILQIIDRSGDLTITSQTTQERSEALKIAGKMKEMGPGVLNMRIFGPDEFKYGPEQVITTAEKSDADGIFLTTVPVKADGLYRVTFSDKTGYIGEYEFIVTSPAKTEIVKTVTESSNETPIAASTTVPTVYHTPVTPTPVPTKSPVPATTILFGIASVSMLLWFARKRY